ncbi:Os03g0275800 [Oryza sativa Japonica Group]|uniref:Os03g0275800 protein n=2 Tax=Oryza sativa subsp. japonica TaxID=39947 RepID=Q0DT14_ORYSJ|nr:Os03g0275800 [Oryza sativa Japonica Group]BAS83509.1 Os03g0275800 [Oryza sativa Japonica Group]|eukprot:NP_001049710.1 Os03g0275800 [Oryza sativa Japonica Group]
MRMREAADHAHKCRGHGAVSRLFPTVVHAARERVPSIHMRRGEERPDFPPHRRISQGPSRRRGSPPPTPTPPAVVGRWALTGLGEHVRPCAR